MPSILSSCEQFFGTRDLYELLGIAKNASTKEVKKAYYKVSLQVHPDRVAEEDKNEATEKFKVLSKIHGVLSDSGKRELYDKQGIVADDDDDSNSVDWSDLWRKFYNPITNSEIDAYKQDYIGSDLEKTDIRKAYLNGKGCWNHINECVPFMNINDEDRIQAIVQEWIDAGDVPEFKIFTEEPATKRKRRHKKYERESKDVQSQKELDKKTGAPSLEQMIIRQQALRHACSGGFFDQLMEKYANVSDKDDFRVSKKKPKNNAALRKEGRKAINNGRVAKTRSSKK